MTFCPIYNLWMATSPWHVFTLKLLNNIKRTFNTEMENVYHRKGALVIFCVNWLFLITQLVCTTETRVIDLYSIAKDLVW